MRPIKYIILHCTAGPQNQKIEAIQAYWKNTLKWSKPGYHHLIEAGGKVHDLAPISQITNGVANYNANSIHISYIGGVDKTGKPMDNRTNEQRAAMLSLVTDYKKRFPNAVVLGHRDFSTDLNGNGIIEQWEWIKHCPAFDVRDWLQDMNKESAFRPLGIVYKLNYPLIKDSNVLLIQKALNRQGIKITEDCVFGKETHDAVIAFQKKRGLAADGIVGHNTIKALGI